MRLFHLLRTGSAPGGSVCFPMRWSTWAPRKEIPRRCPCADSCETIERRTSALSPSRQTAANVRFLYAKSEDRKLRPCLKNVNHILHTVSGNTDTSVQWPETVCRCDLLSEKLRIYPGGRDAALARRWRTAYPRRRNMLDELVKAGY